MGLHAYFFLSSAAVLFVFPIILRQESKRKMSSTPNAEYANVATILGRGDALLAELNKKTPLHFSLLTPNVYDWKPAPPASSSAAASSASKAESSLLDTVQTQLEQFRLHQMRHSLMYHPLVRYMIFATSDETLGQFESATRLEQRVDLMINVLQNACAVNFHQYSHLTLLIRALLNTHREDTNHSILKEWIMDLAKPSFWEKVKTAAYFGSNEYAHHVNKLKNILHLQWTMPPTKTSAASNRRKGFRQCVFHFMHLIVQMLVHNLGLTVSGTANHFKVLALLLNSTLIPTDTTTSSVDPNQFVAECIIAYQHNSWGSASVSSHTWALAVEKWLEPIRSFIDSSKRSSSSSNYFDQLAVSAKVSLSEQVELAWESTTNGFAYIVAGAADKTRACLWYVYKKAKSVIVVTGTGIKAGLIHLTNGACEVASNVAASATGVAKNQLSFVALLADDTWENLKKKLADAASSLASVSVGDITSLLSAWVNTPDVANWGEF